MIRRVFAKCALGILPKNVKRRLGVHLGAPDLEWSLRQLRRFGFCPKHILDVGAFEGGWATMCLQMFPASHITCIEPQEASQRTLRDFEGNHPNVKVVQTLLGRHVRERVPFEDRGTGSCVFCGVCGEGSAKPMTTIDALISKDVCCPPEFLKLDVQGYEIEVLEGWTRGFEQCEVIQIEMSLLPLVPGAPLLHEVVAYLHRRGFVIYDIEELICSPSDGAVWQIDVLCCRENSPLRTERVWAAQPAV